MATVLIMMHSGQALTKAAKVERAPGVARRVGADMLGIELRDLEVRWRSAEAIAAIVDQELT
jgi:hypothetical protein